MNFNLEDIVAIVLLIMASALLGSQYMERKYSKKRKLKYIKYSCGVEGDCEESLNGVYDTREQCETSCKM